MSHPQKVGVLTFHRCINYGSYWQARCLVEGLRARGLDAVVLEHRSPRVDRAEWTCALRPLAPAPTPRSDRPLYAAKTRKFFQAFEDLPPSAPFDLEDPSAMEPFDIVVVGSDEVWNQRHPWYGGYPLFFGEGVNACRLIAYAASFGNQDADHGLEPAWADRLRRFEAIGVRDENSRRLVREALGCVPALVLDPCLQFEAVCRRPAEPGDQAIVYGHSFPEPFKQAVRAWADSRGIRLVSLGYGADWTHTQWIDAGPEDFAQAMGTARAVITNFFHGCVFALANAKPFVCVQSDYRANKVTALTASLGLQARLVSAADPQACIAEALDTPVAAEALQRIETLRQRSRAYLDHALH